jgi:hypothetical protein
MAAKLGSTDVSFRLGAGEVAAVYRGAQEVWSVVPVAITLYFFNAGGGGDWTTVGNWWLDAGHTQPAGRLPAEIDSVVASSGITASGQTVVDFTTANDATLLGTLTVTGMATFNGFSVNQADINGDVTFNDSSFNSGGTITGTITDNT